MEMEITTSVDKNVQLHFAPRTAEEERPKKEKAFLNFTVRRAKWDHR